MTEKEAVNINTYDEHIKIADWLEESNQPTALVLTETLEPALGRDAIIFPPTFARGDRAEHPYSIDDLRTRRASVDFKVTSKQPVNTDNFRYIIYETENNGDYNTCLIDSVGSQANRMENRFVKNESEENLLGELVPQITVDAKVQQTNLLKAGHRIADAAVRFSELEDEARASIKAMADNGNALMLAQLAPTSLVFGFWDSRDTQYKSGRLLSSTIRASNVALVTRSAQFNPTFDPAKINLAEPEDSMADEVVADLPEAEKTSAKGKKDPLSQLGMKSAPAPDTHGGVRVNGEIVRRTQLSMVGLRSLVALNDDKKIDAEQTLKLRRYILGLGLIAARCQKDYDLREGCLLVGSQSKPAQSEIVFSDGRRESFDWDKRTAYEFASLAAQEFGVSPSKTVNFSVDKVRAALKKAEDKKAGKSPRSGKK